MKTAGQHFRDLFAAEQTAAGYQALVAILEAAKTPETYTPIFAEELRRLVELVEEFENDADERRDAILEAGFTPEQYEAWMARQ